MDFTPEEMEAALLGKTYASDIRINPATVVIDAAPFLTIQFDMVKRYKGDINRCAAWQRLKEFYQATTESPKSAVTPESTDL